VRPQRLETVPGALQPARPELAGTPSRIGPRPRPRVR
jgi:hypothetical protein